MRIIRLQTQGFQRVTALDITPESDVVEVRGNNGEGKTSLLESIMAALGGADAAPIKPIRTGDDFAAIRLTIGDGKPDLIVEKYFDEVGEKLRVTTADGAEFKAGQTKAAELLGRMTFDPLEFARMTPKDQAVELRRLVPLKVDLDQLAAADKADTAARRDVNRDGKALAARVDAIPVETDLPEERPDVDALTATLASAAEVNTAIDRERMRRLSEVARIEEGRVRCGEIDAEVTRLEARIAELRDSGARIIANGLVSMEALEALPPLDEPIDTTAAGAAIAEARATIARFERKEARDRLSAELEALRATSREYTEAMAERAKLRADALAEAEMPVPGLSLARICDVVPGETAEDLIVVYEGEPFAQSSGAQKLRVSMRLAMAANPTLRVMLIRDGSLLDANGLALVKELAAGERYQVWLESVGEGDGSGIIMEAGAVRGAPEPERFDPPKRRRPKGEAEEVKAPASPASAAEATAQRATLVEGRDGLAREPAAEPTRRRSTAMREFTTKPAGDLFGGGE
jgi:hypothetical protein